MPELQTLVGLFYPSTAPLGRFEPVERDLLSAPYRRLLAHRNHMTVTVEEYHKSPVTVRVLEKYVSGEHYARMILLCRQSDGQVVQFGIMRLNFSFVDDAVRREVERQSTPLGRILIEHNVLREINLVQLWKVTTGPELSGWFDVPPATITYGRTALIRCNGEPAVELLEIVTPATESIAP